MNIFDIFSVIKNRDPWFAAIPASSSSEEDVAE